MEGELTPILWIVTQEDSTHDGNLTLYSRYTVDHERYTGFGAPTNRMLLRLVDDESSLLPDMNVWPDNSNTSEWYYLDIQEATNSHDYERIGDSNYESWISMREDPDWKQYER